MEYIHYHQVNLEIHLMGARILMISTNHWLAANEIGVSPLGPGALGFCIKGTRVYSSLLDPPKICNLFWSQVHWLLESSLLDSLIHWPSSNLRMEVSSLFHLQNPKSWIFMQNKGFSLGVFFLYNNISCLSKLDKLVWLLIEQRSRAKYEMTSKNRVDLTRQKL